jgi:L-rhamnose mutarotase
MFQLLPTDQKDSIAQEISEKQARNTLVYQRQKTQNLTYCYEHTPNSVRKNKISNNSMSQRKNRHTQKREAGAFT